MKVCVTRLAMGELGPGIGYDDPPVDMGTIRFMYICAGGGGDSDIGWDVSVGEKTGDIGAREYIEIRFGGGGGVAGMVSVVSSSGIESGTSMDAKERGWAGGSIGVSSSRLLRGGVVVMFARSSFPGELVRRVGLDAVGERGACGRLACRRSNKTRQLHTVI